MAHKIISRKKDDNDNELPTATAQLKTMKKSHSRMRNAPLDEDELKSVKYSELMAHKKINDFYNINSNKRMPENFGEEQTHYFKEINDEIISSNNRKSVCDLEFPPIGLSCAGNNAGMRFQEFIRIIDPSYCDIHGLTKPRCSSTNKILPNPRKVCARFISI
ncbi:unnamed protein product [Oikopleura dioica]|uniref:Uncharacterized protein n=2 Tax=Oikopleura dioica TaxID=34765 RepID=E4YLQ9_OIKDI|nr:unnamed protein product [Oikopleura dioica]